MAPEQGWCLECGSAATTRVVRAPGWGLPVAIVIGALAVVAAITVIAINSLQDDADKAAGPAKAAAPARSAPARTARPARAIAGVPLWPIARRGYTVIVAAPSSQAIALTKARALRRLGRDAGILHSDEYDFLSPGLWVVWRGKFPTRAAAERSALNVKRVVPSAYATLVRKKTP